MTASAQVEVISDDGSGTGTTTWTNDNVYILDGFVFVNEGQVLTIEEGTVIKGMPGTGADASALIVARGGQIFAEGTAEEPIIFTFEADPLDGSTPFDTRGEWGGLIVLGDAQLNSTPGETQIEGIPETEPRGLYGGDNDEDNSGVIRYVSVRHGGSDIGAGNEINGITLGGVGSGTTIEYVEVFSNVDDGIEFFGGTVDVKYATVAFCGDDSYDYDEGWRGKGQFWLTVQDAIGGEGDRGGEHDGGTDPEDGMPFTTPVIYNATYIGRGIDANRRALTFRDNAGGEYHNSIFANWGRGIDIENLADGEDSYARFQGGDLALAGNVFQDVTADGDLCTGQPATAEDIFTISMGSGWASEADSIAALEASTAAFVASFDGNGNSVAETGIEYVLDQENGGLNPVPTTNFDGGTPATDDFFDAVSFKGAFDPAADNWLLGWSALDSFGFLQNDTDCGQTITITDDGSGTGTTTWFACNEYILDGFVFVNEGQCLTIEAGTVIKGAPGTGADASALIVARGGKIFAEGTADAPIIFTFEADPLDGSTPYDTRGEWGGLLVLGNAQLNSTPGETQIEGIPETEPRGLYGGNDDEDNSGVLKYISIRHGGTDIGAGNEINGLSLGGVGSGTTIEHIEVISNADDGIEFFGGTVRVKYATVAFCGDDSFDYDEGWRGFGQYWFTVQDEPGAEGDRGGEHDGGTDPEDGTPYTTPKVFNATYIGRGIDAGRRAVTFRDNAGGEYHNSVFANWGRGIDIENLADGEDSYERFLAGDLALAGNVFQDVTADGDLCTGQPATAEDIFKISMGSGWASEADSIAALEASTAAFVASFDANGNSVADLGLDYVILEGSGGLDPVPVTNFGGGTPATDDWFDAVTFKGAFNPDEDNWLFGWTLLDAYGFIGEPESDDCDQVITVTDTGAGTGTTTWQACNTYLLDGFVFVNEGQCLTIEAGTVIKGLPGTGADASALVVARGGKIFAEGTEENPIIFTFEADPLDGSTPYDTNGEWGGLIVLGNASLNSTPGETQIEGIPETEPRGLYGGNDDEDNSGVIRYVSVRHGGSDIGAGNEINGITLGGVGNGTTVEHVEVISNFDDGIEFFGGTVDVKYACVAFCGDDSFDYDEGWRGKGQFWFTVQDDSGDGTGDRGGEHDGGTDPEDGTPFTTPEIYNATYIGRGIDAGRRALTFRDNAGGKYMNSIFYNWGRGVDIENLADGEDSFARFEAGDLELGGNCFWNVTEEGAAEAADIFTISMGEGWESEADSLAALASSTDTWVASFEANGNAVEDPILNYEVTEGSEQLNPKPLASDVSATPPSDPWYTAASYKGAFDPSENCTWLHGWSFLDERMFIGCFTGVEDDRAISGDALTVYPNPNNGIFTVELGQATGIANLDVVDLTGRIVANTPLNNLPAGSQVNVDLSGFDKGIYLVQLQNGTSVKTARVIVR